MGSLFAILCLLWGEPAGALGVGEMRTQSALNQPFYGEIRLFDVDENGLDNVKASLASRSAFEQAGIERPHSLTRLQFRPMIGPGGEPIIQVVTREPVREPYLDMLVEVVWPDGRLLKEYAVLLDPPAVGGARNARESQPRQGLTPRSQQTRSSPFVQAAEAGSGRSGPEDQQSAPSSVPSQASELTDEGRAARVQVPASASEVRFPLHVGPVPPGAGLARIARQIAPPGATVEQTALALYRNNQHAFLGGDINRLRLGAELSIPSAAELFVLDPETAVRVYRAALAGRDVARAPLTDRDVELRIATGDGWETAGGASEGLAQAAATQGAETAQPAATTPPGAAELEAEMLLVREASEANRQEATELRERIRALEARLDDIQRLLALRNQQLAQLALTGAASQSADIDARADEADAALDEADAAVDEATATAENGAATPASPSERAEGATDSAAQERTADGHSETAAAAESGQRERAAAVEPASPAPEIESRPQSETATAARTVPEQQSEPEPSALIKGWLDSLPAWAMPVAGGAIVLVLLALLIQRRRQQAQLAATPALEEDTDAGEGPSADAPNAQHLEPERPTTRPLPNALVVGPLSPTKPSKTVVDTDTDTETEVEAETVAPGPEDHEPLDRLAEADIYLGYGRYRDAAHVLNEIAAEQPSPQLRFKLAEIYAAAKDEQALASLADEMRAAGDPEVDPERWAQIQGAFDAVGAGVSADEEEPLTLDALPDPDRPSARSSRPDAPVDAAPAPDLELASAPTQQVMPERAPEAPEESAQGAESDELFLDLDELDGLEKGGYAASDPLSSSPETDAAREGSAPRGLPIPELIDEADRDHVSDDSELNDKERLELDLAALGDLMDESAHTGVTDSAAADLGAAAPVTADPVAADPVAADPVAADRAVADRAVAGPAAVKGPSLEREQDEPLELPTLSGLPDEAVELERSLTATSANESGESAEAVLIPPTAPSGASDADGGWPLESEDWDEVSLKLDLARAYLDMGDSEAAATILNEVVAEGREEQRQEAGALLARLGSDDPSG
nr:FimV/HubP family polar landmark protein [Halochromatium glycolicum]